ncbi:hypothetical protein LLG90_08255 [Aromatoleum toluclasticum]|uniref:hypothetical protein n=1 Tax=Aromatoleum toluclasticum TaxID=92003 RepID=UPI001D189E3E|nr:hypothetical protein [Aromatoleum toluclasticum]MCC4115336.1 hypothetical protein [Aromatoleum toluclasticum]
MTALTKAVRESVSRSVAELAESISGAETDRLPKVQDILRQREVAMADHASAMENVAVLRAAASDADALIARAETEAQEAEQTADTLAIQHLADIVDAAQLDNAISRAGALGKRVEVLRKAVPLIQSRIDAAVKAARMPADAVSDLNARLDSVRAEVSVLIARERLGC